MESERQKWQFVVTETRAKRVPSCPPSARPCATIVLSWNSFVSSTVHCVTVYVVVTRAHAGLCHQDREIEILGTRLQVHPVRPVMLALRPCKRRGKLNNRP